VIGLMTKTYPAAGLMPIFCRNGINRAVPSVENRGRGPRVEAVHFSTVIRARNTRCPVFQICVNLRQSADLTPQAGEIYPQLFTDYRRLRGGPPADRMLYRINSKSTFADFQPDSDPAFQRIGSRLFHRSRILLIALPIVSVTICFQRS
jgi:hypothetical protein